MALPFYNWSRTASSNATADSTINWAEGQSPSSVNDSARAMMASTAAFRDDIAGAITTAGTSTAYTVSSYQVFDSYAHMSGQMIAFTPHATNGDSPTLNVDGLGARFLRGQSGQNLQAGVLIAGTPYVALYSNANTEFVLHAFFGQPYSIPLGASIDFWGDSAPNSSFALAYGQAISRTTYASLFSMFGTTYGTGDGSTTFNIPDLRGRIVAGKDDMGGSAASRLTSTTITSGAAGLGNSGGGETRTLVTANLPPYTPTGNVSTSLASSNTNIQSTANGGTASFATNSTVGNTVNMGGAYGLVLSSSFTGSAQGGTSTAFGIVQPTIIANKLIRII